MKNYSPILLLRSNYMLARNACKFIFYCFSFLVFTGTANAQRPTELWTRFYSDPSGGMDIIRDVVTDNVGNVLVTGVSESASFGDQCVTIKYSTTGRMIWTKVFNSIGDEGGNAITVDRDGNSYVTGSSKSAAATQIFIIKYDASGNTVWERFHSGRVGKFISLNNVTGDVIVSGTTPVSGCTGSCTDSFVTFCFNSAGTLRWSRPVVGHGTTDVLEAMAIDNSGDVYVTGTSYELTSAGTEGEIITVKYDRDGRIRWANAYSSTPRSHHIAADLTLDEFDNVYVLGQGENPTVLMYSPTGTLTRTIREPATDMYARNIRVRGNNLYITFVPFWSDVRVHTVGYNISTGAKLWENLEGHKVTSNVKLQLDSAGNIYVGATSNTATGSDAMDHWIVKYDVDGARQWKLEHRDNGQWLEAFHIDEDDNLYTGGRRLLGGGASDYFATKYTSFPPSSPPGPAPITPEGLEDYRRMEFWAYASSRDWCWTDILIDWDLFCPVPPFCPDPTTDGLLVENGKTIWQGKFSKPGNYALPVDDKSPRLFSLARAGKEAFVVLDDNLVSSGFSSISVLMSPADNKIKLTAETDGGKDVSFTMSLLNKDGKQVWQETFMAPIQKEIQAYANEPGTTLKFSALPQQVDFKYYSNPFHENLMVEVEASELSPADIYIVNMQGEKILHEYIETNEPRALNMTKQKPGLYILLVRMKGNEKTVLVELK